MTDWWEAAPLAKQAPVPAAPQSQDNWWEAAPLVSAAPDPSTSVGMEMGDQILSLGGAVPSAAPVLAGGLNYIKEGGAEGSYGRGHDANIARHEQSRTANPRATIIGDVASALIPIPGVAAAAAPRLAARAVEGALRWGGRAGQGLTAYSVYNDLQRGETPGVGDLLSFALGRGSTRLARTMRESRLAATAAKRGSRPMSEAMKAEREASSRVGGLQGSETPPGLSQEMLDALKRGKFRHQYHNVKGGI